MLDSTRPGARLVGGAVVAMLLLGGATVAEASTKKVVKHTRTVKLSYTGGCTVEAYDGGSGAAFAPGECAAAGAASYSLTARRGEKYLTVKVTDASGKSVPGDFWVQGHITSTEYQFCGAMKNFRIPASSFDLDLDAVGAVTGCPGVATTGKITLVFSNLP